MPWCPKCKNEYKEGITVCTDCECELVEEEPIEQSEIERLQEEFDKMSDEEKEAFKESVKQAVYEAERKNKGVKPVLPYENNASKAEDNKTSAYMLLFFGIIGMVIVILGIVGVLPIHLSGAGKYMTYGVMSALFILFIVMGLVSMKSYRVFAKKAETEDSLRSTMEKWCKDNLKAEDMDAVLFTENTDSVDAKSDEESEFTEEMKYFKRTSFMKDKISVKFMNLDEAFLDNFIDEIYTVIYEEA